MYPPVLIQVGNVVGGPSGWETLMWGAVLAAAGAVIANQVGVIFARITERKGLAYALAAELEALRLRYTQAHGEAVPNPEDYGFEEPRFNYFVVFESNAGKIGILKREDVEEVVRLYVLAKGHFENKINWAKWDTSAWPPKEKDRFIESLRRDHAELLKAVPVLCSKLKLY